MGNANDVCDHRHVPNSEPGPCGVSGQDLFSWGSANAQGSPEALGENGGMMQRWSDGDMSGSMRGKSDGSWAFQGDKESGIGKHRGQDAENCVTM
mmetsp:Transcript_42323/g.78840  ORF Transcript_42323/g.78840 Transcript_42323/m.78840 type:complete len:95 (+) Transcript_42323:78-362(+)